MASVLDFAMVKTDGIYVEYLADRGRVKHGRTQVLLTIFRERLGKLLTLRKKWEDRKRKLPKKGKLSTSKRWKVTSEGIERWQSLFGPEKDGNEGPEMEGQSEQSSFVSLYDAMLAANNWFEEPYYSYLRGPAVTSL